MFASGSLILLLPASWLLPNHYLPWVTAYQDGLAVSLLLLAALSLRGGAKAPALWMAALGLSFCVITMQSLAGLLHYRGDALMAALYIAAFAMALLVGASIGQQSDLPTHGAVASGQRDRLALWASSLLAAAIYSVGIALSQWTQTSAITFVVPVDLPPGGRPFANFGQPNHLCSAAFLGLCMLALLFETRRIGRTGFWLGAAFLLLGMVASGSRTGWLQVAALVLLVLLMQGRAGLRLGGRAALCLGLLYGALLLAWPWANQALLLDAARPLADQLSDGSRLQTWAGYLQALALQPWAGYGWQQAVLVQQVVPLPRPYEHTHNLVLDLLIWNGLPLGGLLILLFGAVLWQQWRAARCPRSAWLLLAAAGLLVHAQLEYPLQYAYFLLPLGLMLGMAHGLQPSGAAWAVPSWLLRSVAAGLLLLLAAVAADYLKAEESFRQLRFEAAQIGPAGAPSAPPQLRVLDQLEDYLWFVRTPARKGMAAEDLERMAAVARRIPHPPVLLRQALAAGLNGNPAAARQALDLVCKIHPPQRCTEGVASWEALQALHPDLRPIHPPQPNAKAAITPPRSTTD